MAEKYAKRYHVGLGNVGSYQVSAKPFITSSIQVPVSGASSFESINFPYVTKFVTIKNDGPNSHGATLRVAFSADGLKDENNNYFILSGSESFSADLKVTKTFNKGMYRVIDLMRLPFCNVEKLRDTKVKGSHIDEIRYAGKKQIVCVSYLNFDQLNDFDYSDTMSKFFIERHFLNRSINR